MKREAKELTALLIAAIIVTFFSSVIIMCCIWIISYIFKLELNIPYYIVLLATFVGLLIRPIIIGIVTLWNKNAIKRYVRSIKIK